MARHAQAALLVRAGRRGHNGGQRMKATAFVKSLFGDDEHEEQTTTPAATSLLKRQHQEVSDLFEQLQAALRGEKRDLLLELAAKLVAHSAIEKEIFYPALRRHQSEDVVEAVEEHALVEHCLARALATRAGDESFDARVRVLCQVVDHHVQEEERELLKQAESDLSSEQLDELGESMLERFEEIVSGDWEAVLAQGISAATVAGKGAGKTATASAAKPPRRATAPKATTTRGRRARAKASKSAAKKPAPRTSRKRELVAPRGDRRFVRRDAKGRFNEVVDAGRSLSQDRRRKAKTRARRGEGDRGDR